MRNPQTATAEMEADEGYDQMERLIQSRVQAVAAPLFTTDADPQSLWDGYLLNLPAERRQHYNCNCCRRFLQKYGGLLTPGTGEGEMVPVVWGEPEAVPTFFRDAVNSLSGMLKRAKVTGVFLSSEPEWGQPRTGNWSHLCGKPPSVFKSPVKTAEQAMAEKKQDFQILSHSLADYSVEVVAEALRVLQQDALYRSEKAVAVAHWFHDLHQKLKGKAGPARSNLIWQAVATAPVGFCHVRTTVISTLLDDIAAGLPFDAISGRWKQKLHPLQYQRPTAAPAVGAIEQAEKLVEKLGLAPAFSRRFAALSDVLLKWWEPPQQREAVPATGGLFDHLRPDRALVNKLDLPPVPVTWAKFQRTVLPLARRVEVLLPHRGAFYGLVTAADPAAPPLLQWDGLEGQKRNPVSWYFYSNGSAPSHWNLTGGSWVPVAAVFPPPTQWQQPEKFKHHGDKVFFALSGCWDSNSAGAGLGLFPECLRSELHGVRAVLEAHSRRGAIAGAEAGTANGFAFDGKQSLTVRVDTDAGRQQHVIDRFD